MRWLGQIVRMDDDRMPKELIHEELSQGTSPTGRPQLRFKDVYKGDLKDWGSQRQAVNQTGPRQIGISMRTCYCLYIAYAFYGWCIYALYNKEQNKKTTLEENK